MSTSAYTSITIGGELPASKLEQFAAALIFDSLDFEVDAGEISVPEMVEMINGYDKELPTRAIEFVGHCPWGNPSATIAFCHENNLTYRRFNESFEGFSADIAGWDPTQHHKLDCLCDADGTPVVAISELHTLPPETPVSTIVEKLDWFLSKNVPVFQVKENE